jgi:hypothetical protein
MDKITLALNLTDVNFLIRALDVFRAQIDLLNCEALEVDEDTLSDLNNDSEYLSGLRRHLEAALKGTA